MKIHFKDISAYLEKKPRIEDLSEKLFQLGHEHEIKNDIFDFEFTPNRGDCLSVFGLARDLKFFYGLEKNIELYSDDIDELNLDFKNKSPEDCPKISFIEIEIEPDIKPYKEYIKNFFDFSDSNTNNFFSDISNYLSYELGQPTHCFDKSKILGELSFETRECSEEFETLLNSKINLSGANSIFSLDGKIISLAGVMGGKSTACDNSTTKVLIECAYFRPEAIIGKTIKYNLNSDSAHKFERGVDILSHNTVLRRFIKIIDDHASIKSIKSFEFNNHKFKPAKIEASNEKINAILGTQISSKEFDDYLKSLGFVIETDVVVPSYRNDIKSVNDIAEEIARVYGYNRIKNRSISIKKALKKETNNTEYSLRNFLVQNGFNEVINFPFSGESDIDEKNIRVDNPLDSNKPFLRIDLKDSLVENVLYNEKRQKDSIKLFEFSNIYKLDSNIVQESKLGIIASGRVGHNFRDFQRKIDQSYLNKIFGELFEEEKTFAEISRDNLDTKIKNKIFYLEISIDEQKIKENFYNELPVFNIDKKYKPISEQPSSSRDFSFSIHDPSKLDDLYKIINSIDDENLKDFFMFDFYKDPKNKVIKVGYRFVFQTKDKTLSENDIQKSVSKIIEPILSLENISIPGM
ncbi:phenylalanine--tRNA ligase subunit beta [Pseudomonadota bacterium]|nr:phenylalanine--tRNA ligase subunit beta [Pseudomonadota bacterium]